jgi:uncharacterized protein (DUF885 family)
VLHRLVMAFILKASNLFKESLLFKSYCAAAVAAVLFSSCTPSSEQTTNPAPEAVAKQTPVATASTESQRVNAFFERVFEESVARYPEYLTSLGRKERADEWNDLSEAYANESMQLTKQQLVELKAFDRNKLDPATVLSYDLLVQSMENDIADNKWRLYNYPINQMFGRHSGVVSLLINQHRIDSVQDAENYITRLEGVPKLFEQLITNIEARTAANIIPPKFVFPHVIRDSNNIIKGAPFDDGEPSALLADLTKKLQTLSEKEGSQLTDENKTRLLDAAILALNNAVKPAYQKLVAHLTELETKATTDDGVWKWKNGDTFYNVALKRTTTTDLTAAQIHEIGLKEVARIHDEMRVIKDKVNFEGDLQAFMQFMRDDDQFYYPNTDEGKARYLREATALIDDMKLKLDGMFITQPKADLNVKAVEAFVNNPRAKRFINAHQKTAHVQVCITPTYTT